MPQFSNWLVAVTLPNRSIEDPMTSALRESAALPKPELAAAKPSTSSKPHRGIFDWDQKFDAIERLATSKGGGGNNQQIAAWILNVKENDKDAERLSGSFKSWHWREGGSLPTGDIGRKFVAAVVARFQEFGCTSETAAAVLLYRPYQEFWELFPEKVRKALKTPSQLEAETHTLVRDHDAFHPLWIARGLALERTKPNRGRIDQKFYFLNPDSAHTWREVINSGQYRQYLECSDALDTFLADEDDQVWRKFISSGKADGAVMLGGGGPSKDLAVIGSMLDQAPTDANLHYALVDISIYMLMSSVQLIDSSLILENRRGRVHLCPLIWDFMNLAGAGPKLRRPEKNVAWFLPGGTIGNLNEQAFFHSISQESEPGDLFIVGAETLGSADLEAEKTGLIKKYKHPAIRGFLGTPLRAAWHELKLQTSLDEALDNLAIDVVDGLGSRHSTVPGSAAVEIAVNANNEKIVLLTSTRYTESSFCETIEAHHFKHELTVPSRKNKNYKQFVFRKIP